MIAFVQPYGLASPGGGARILSRMLPAAPGPVLSVCTAPQAPPPLAAPSAHARLVEEVHLPLRPSFGRLESTRLARHLGHVERLSGPWLARRLLRLCQRRGVTAIHALPHSIDFAWAAQVARELKLPFFLSVHDDLSYNMRGHPLLPRARKALAEAWANADGRTVISQEMGEVYDRRYGARSWSVVTDGLERPEDLKAVPAEERAGTPSSRRLRVYFMGALHLTYQPNFEALVQVLGQVHTTDPQRSVSLLVRGSTPQVEVPVPCEVLPWGPQEAVEEDLRRADVLYLPLPFDAEYDDFVRLSLSTKLVTYLGSGVPILYHGPHHAAAARLLERYGASAGAYSLDSQPLQEALLRAADERAQIVEAAARCARERFRLADHQHRFWKGFEQHRPVEDKQVLVPRSRGDGIAGDSEIRVVASDTRASQRDGRASGSVAVAGRPRLDLVFPALPPALDGIGDHTARLATALAERWDVRVLTAQSNAERLPGVRVKEAFSLASRRGVQALEEAVADDLPDWLLLQFNQFSYGRWGFNPYLPRVVRRIRRACPATRVAVLFHEDFVPVTSWKNAIITAWQRAQFVALGRSAEVVGFSIEPWARRYRTWFPQAQVAHWPVGSNIPHAGLSRQAARDRLQLGADAFVVGVFGTLHTSRMLPFIARAVQALHRKPSTEMIVLYVGPDGDRLKAAVPGIPVHDAGRLPAEEVSHHLSAMDVHLAPFSDGASTRRGSLLAGLQHGVATVSTRGSLTDPMLLEQANQALLLVPAGDPKAFEEQVLMLCDDPQRRQRMGAAGRALYEDRFAWDVLADRLAADLGVPFLSPSLEMTR